MNIAIFIFCLTPKSKYDILFLYKVQFTEKPMKSTAYEAVYQTLKKWILDEKYKAGDLLPPEPALDKMLRVSRTTVRRAVDMLSREGLVRAQQGFGTVVLDYKTMQNLNTITSFTETLLKRGYEVSLKSISIDKSEASETVAAKLMIPAGSTVARIQRVSCASGVPIAIIKNYIPYDLVPGIEERRNEILSLYKFLAEQYMFAFEMSRDRIYAKAAEFEQACLLDVAAGFPLLCSERVCFSRSTPVIYDKLIIRSDMYEFDISLYGK